MARFAWNRACRRAPLLLSRTLVVALAATIVAVAGATPAAAPTHPDWVGPRNLSAKGADSVIPDVVADGNGNLVVVWAQARGSSWTVQAVERPAGGPWSAPTSLSRPANLLAPPQVAIAGKTAVAVWGRHNGRNLLVQASEMNPQTHAWTTPVSLSASGRDAQVPRVAVDAKGDAVVVWKSVSLAGWTVDTAYRPAGGSWQKATSLQPAQPGTDCPSVVLDDKGRAVALWSGTAGGNLWRVEASARGADGTWSKSTAISAPDPTGATICPQVALEPNGDVLAVWSRSDGTSTVLESATRNASTGAWSPAAQLFGVNAVAPVLAVDRRGDAVVVWWASRRSGSAVEAAYQSAGKPWGAPVVLSSSGSGPLAPQVAIDSSGDAVAVWARSAGRYLRVRAASFVAKQHRWSTPRLLSGVGEDAVTPQVSLDDGGDGAAVWARFDGRSFVIQADGYDDTGPDLEQVSIPLTGVVGSPLSFGVRPKDQWTPVKTIRWSFGDGSSADGRVARHVYRRAGRFATWVTATDVFGHGSAMRRFVTISP